MYYKIDSQILFDTINKKYKEIKMSIQNAKKIAESRGGQCLSTTYKNAKEKLEWKCNNKEHGSWLAPYESIVNKGAWCPKCAGRYSSEYLLKKAQDYAKLKGGNLLSDKY